jgi:hypothetical protein
MEGRKTFCIVDLALDLARPLATLRPAYVG